MLPKSSSFIVFLKIGIFFLLCFLSKRVIHVMFDVLIHVISVVSKEFVFY